MKHRCQARMFQNENFETLVPGTDVSFFHAGLHGG